MRKVTEPGRVVTDELVLKELLRQGADSDYVEFWRDYSPEHPSTKFYRDLKNKRTIAVISGTPKVATDGGKVIPKWFKLGVKYKAGNNLFSATVINKSVGVVCKGKTANWSPQVFLKLPGLDEKEIQPKSGNPVLLFDDPANFTYKRNTLEWDYGICKRRLRIIEGQLIERYIFESDPGGGVTIKSNWTGDIKAARNWAKDATNNLLKVETLEDAETIDTKEFAEQELFKTYPDISPDEKGLSYKGHCTGCGLCGGNWDAINRANPSASLEVLKQKYDEMVDKWGDGVWRWQLPGLVPAECGYDLYKDGKLVDPVISSKKYPITVASSPETFNPSVDGQVKHSENLSWTNLRAAAGNSSNDSADMTGIELNTSTVEDVWESITRAIVVFDTSSLPGVIDITDATLTVYGRSKATESGWVPSLNVYLSDPSSNTALEAGDYDSLEETAFSTAIAYSSYSVDLNNPAANDFVFNPTGIAAISKTGHTKLGLREATYDGTGDEPSWKNNKTMYFSFYTNEKGGGFVPKLVVTYIDPKMCFSDLTVEPELTGDLTSENELSGDVSNVSKVTGNLSNESCDGSGI